MTWCCHVCENLFRNRNEYGEFVVAGLSQDRGEVVFLRGFNLCHRKDYSAVLAAIRLATEAIQSEGISNFKLSGHRSTRFCEWCGADLQKHYGEDGGLLRDDGYVRKLQAT